jgi:cytochrome P450
MQYLKRGKSIVLPQFSSPPLVILPSSSLPEVMNMSDDQLDVYTINREDIAQRHTIGPHAVGPHIDIVRRQLTRKLPTLAADVQSELVDALHQQFGVTSPEQEVSVNAFATCMNVVSRAANRVFCGTTLCRNAEFLDSSQRYAVAIFTCGGLMKMLPHWSHPLLAPFLTRDVEKYRNICQRIVVPEIRDRLRHLQSTTKDPSYQEPNDALQWLLIDSLELAKSDPTNMHDDTIVQRLLVLNMVAIHTTTIVSANVLLDIYGSPDRDSIVAGIRDECTRVLAEHDGIWTKDAINKLVRVDSALRETMRISNMSDTVLKRIVRDPHGITLRSGLHIPQGIRIGFATHDIHQDPLVYPERPTEYDAFRFSRPREAYLERVGAGEDAERLQKALEQKNTSLIAVGNEWVGFGNARHACPGRFFATLEMKLLLAQIVTRYDVELDWVGRPPNMRINGVSVPNQEAKLKVRLRAVEG